MKFTYKLTAILLAGIVCFSSKPFTSHATEAENAAENEAADTSQISIESNEISGWPAGPAVSAESAIVMDAGTGTILYSKNVDARQYPASITKLMTVLLALENSSLDETVTFSQNAVFSIERASSHIARTTDEELTMEQCLYAIMLESANECSNAVAEHIAGSTAAFADMMNQKAAELGCTNTHFVNPHGLHDPEHYTSARDMALITQAVLQYDQFREIAGTVSYDIPPTNKNADTLTMYNHHSMICKNRTSKYFDETVFAGKTGFTTDALNTLVTCASRNDMNLICVLLRSPSGTPYPDTASLLDYASGNFSKTFLPGNISGLPEDILNTLSEAAPDYDLGASVLAEQTPACVILPNTVPFEALTPSVSVHASDTASAAVTVSYSYETVPLGSISYQLHPKETSDASSDGSQSGTVQTNTGENSPQPSGHQKNLIKNIVIGAIVLVILLLLTTLILFTVQTNRANARRRKRRASHTKRNRRSSGSRSSRRTGNHRSYDFDDPEILEDFDDFNF